MTGSRRGSGASLEQSSSRTVTANQIGLPKRSMITNYTHILDLARGARRLPTAF
jgi:hypothetical protein